MDLIQILSGENLAESMSEDELIMLGNMVVEHYDTDLESRSEWEDKYIKWLDLAGLKVEQKTKPWVGAANVKYPLLTNAAMQFNARVVPALMPNSEPVGVAPVGPDPDGQKREVSRAIARHMNFQLTTEMEEWEDDMDNMLMSLSLSGTEYKKTYYDSVKRRIVSKHVTPLRLVVNYWATDIATTRKTEVFFWDKNKLVEKVNSGQYVDIDWESMAEPNMGQESDAQIANKERQGLRSSGRQDASSPYVVLEYHGFYDLDEDGYAEPYIITVLEQTKQVLSVTPRFTEDDVLVKEDQTVISITPIESYTKYNFIPNPDGSFYGVGFGHLLYHINSVVNTGVNMLLDNGTLNNLPGGFLGRGLKMRNGMFNFKAGKWYSVNSSGDDLRKNVVPMPINQPSTVLLSLVQFMLESGERLSATNDIFTGEMPGQNSKTGVTQAVLEQGQKVFTAIYKRIRRGLRDEQFKHYRLNAAILATPEDTLVHRSAEIFGVSAEFYNKDLYNIQPSSDPNVAIKEQQIQKDATVRQIMLEEGNPNVGEATRRLLTTMEVENLDQLYPANSQPAPDPKQQEMSAKMQLEQMKLQFEFDAKAKQLEFDRAVAEEEIKIKLLELDMNAAQKEQELVEQRNALDKNLKAEEAKQEHAERSRASE